MGASIMTSQNPARIVLRRKPRRWGHQKFTTAAFKSRATTWAILFSKPSSLSFEKGMTYGSTHTRSSVGARRAATAMRTSAAVMSDAALRVSQVRCIVLPADSEEDVSGADILHPAPKRVRPGTGCPFFTAMLLRRHDLTAGRTP